MIKKNIYISLILCCLLTCSYAQSLNDNRNGQDTLLTPVIADSLLQDSAAVSDTLEFDKRDSSVSVTGNSEDNLEEISAPQHTQAKEDAFDLKFIKTINLISVLRAAAILLASFFVILIIEFIFRKFFFKKRRKQAIPLIAVIKFIIWFAALYWAVNTLFRTSQIAGFIIVLTAAIIIGSAALPLMRNILAGFYLFTKLPFQKGDFISIRDYYGEVLETGWRTTKILNSEGAVVNIPNSVFLQEPFENINIGQKEQLVSIEFSFPANFQIDEIMNILKEAALSSPYAYPKKQPHVFLESADYLNGINKFKLTLHLFDSRYENELISSVNEKVFSEIKVLKENIMRGSDF
jgi:small-conductance mechanosensitive channel